MKHLARIVVLVAVATVWPELIAPMFAVAWFAYMAWAVRP